MATIQSIYQELTDAVLQKRPDVILEPAGTLDQSCVAMEQTVLSSLTAEDFAKTLYFRFLDRPPTPADVRRIAGRLAKRTSTRQAELEKIMSSAEYKKMATKHTIV